MQTDTAFCEQCGSSLPPSSRFCEECGAAATPVDGLTNFTRARELFDRAMSMDPGRRQQWLEETCRAEPALLAEVRSLLAGAETNSFLGRPAQAPPSLVPPIPEATAEALPYDFIGHYRLLRKLGQGGMGVVYLAMRDDGAFRKSVALKILLSANADLLQRFRHERQVLAALDHPNIARILDGGDAPDGRPYYVMEYVEGASVEAYCDAQRLTLTGRIKIFQQICLAVEYLHQNLIVHRDLKPGNILVANDGTVKLLDFGIAKVIDPVSRSSQDETRAELRHLTPAYASPEQLVGGAAQRASDVYSLGVMLYRLLTGALPYENVDDKVEKLVAREAPKPPSERIRPDLLSPESTSRLRRAMMGELDSIVLMALRYDAKDRYQSAMDLSQDLQRFLDGHPVTAHHSGIAGRSVKLIKRKRAVAAAAVLFVAVGSFGVWQWRRNEAQKVDALARESSLRALLDRLDAHPEGQPLEQRIQDLRQLRDAFASDFAAVAARLPGRRPERDELLRRGIRYLDRVRREATTAEGLPTGIATEMAAAYQQLGVLQQSTGDRALSAEAVKTFEKAVSVLVVFVGAHPDDGAAQERMNWLVGRIQELGGTVEKPAPTPPATDAPQSTTIAAAPPERPAPVPPKSQPREPAPPSKQVVVTVPASVTRPTPAAATPPAAAPAQTAAAAIPPELADRLASAESRVRIAEQSVEPTRKSLEQNGQTLNPETLSAMSRMRAALERARRELAAGDPHAADSLAAAEALAARVLRSVGR